MTGEEWDEVAPVDDDDALSALLERDRIWSAYALGDIDPPYRRKARFLGATRRGSLEAVLLLYALGGFTALWAFGPADGFAAILERHSDMPRSAFLLLAQEYLEPLAARYEVNARWPQLRMYLTGASFRPAPLVGTSTQRLGRDHEDAIQALYVHWGTTFFDPVALETGVYYGAFDGEALVAVAGTHVVAPSRGVAAIGGVFTHPDYRGRGLATATTGAAARTLLDSGIDLVVLNVKETNAPAVAAYRRLGFETHKRYVEGTATLR